MPYKGGVQLLPESERRPTLRSYTSGNTYFYLAIGIGVFVLVAFAVLGGYKRNLSDQIDVVTTKIVAGEKSRNIAQEKELIVAAKQSKMINELLDSKIFWTMALTRIEQMIQSSVKFSALDANLAKGIISFVAFADSYPSVARQLAAFSATTGIKDFTIGKIETLASGEIKFSGDLIIDSIALFEREKPRSTPSPQPSP